MIETQISSISYTADGSQTQWDYPYRYFSKEDIKLFITQGDVRVQISPDDYSFDSATNKLTYPLSGDPVPAGATVELSRITEKTQLESSAVNPFTSDDVERMADKLTLITQDLQQEIADIVAPAGGAIAETVASAVQAGIASHNSSSAAHTTYLVAKTGSTMTGDLTIAKDTTSVHGVRFLDEDDSGYRVFSTKGSGSNKQFRMFDISTGTGVFLDSANANKPYYLDGNSVSYRLLDTTDKSELDSAKANTDLRNVSATSGFRRLVEVSAPSILPSWYKVFDEYDPATGDFIGKWCEQGGLSSNIPGPAGLQIYFLKEMADTNYSVFSGVALGNIGDSNARAYCYDRTTTGMTLDWTGEKTDQTWWVVKGYMAVGD